MNLNELNFLFITSNFIHMLIYNVNTATADKRITGILNGVSFNVTFSDALLATLAAAQKDLESIEEVEAYDKWLADVKAVLEASEPTDTITEACKDLMLDTKTGHYYVKVDNKISKHPVPELLVDVILESVEKNIDATPIVKAWIRFLRNPNFTTRKAELFASYITATIIDSEELERLQIEEGFTYEKAVDRATYNDVAITNEGLIVAKKYARLLTQGWEIDQETNQPKKVDLFPTTKTINQFSGEVTETVHYPDFAEDLTFEPPVQGRSGNAFLCGEIEDHIIKVGQKHELKDWSMVNTNDDTTCVKGLHVGGLQYVASYKSLNCQLLDCFVDPADIGAICGWSNFEGSDGAIRVKSYFVYGATDGRTKGIYHSSKYAAMKDAEWEAYKAQAIEEGNKIVAEVTESVNDFDVN